MSDDCKHLAEAAIAVCDQQERWAHADYYYHMTAHQRAEFGLDGPRPWRGIMNPAIVHMIHVLEEMDLYDSPSLPVNGMAANA